MRFAAPLILVTCFLTACAPAPSQQHSKPGPPVATAPPAILAVPPANAPAAVEEQGKYVNSASARLVKLVNVGNKDGFKLANDTFSIGGGWLRRSTKWTALYYINLVANKEYRVIAVGDMDAKDVDVRILDEWNNPIASDTLASPEAIVTFRPRSSGQHGVWIRVFDSIDSQPAVCISTVMIR